MLCSTHDHPHSRGSALVLLLTMSLVLLGFAGAFLTRGLRETQAGAGYQRIARARVAAESLHAQALAVLRSGQVDSRGRNKMLENVLKDGERRVDSAGATLSNELSGSGYRLLWSAPEGRVWASRLFGDYVRLEAEAWSGSEQAYSVVTLLERVPATHAQRFVGGVGVYPGVDALLDGTSPFRDGDVLVVDPLPVQITDAEAKVKEEDIPEEVTLADCPELRTFGAYELHMPDKKLIEDLKDETEKAYKFKKKNGYLVTFLGRMVRVAEFEGDEVELFLPDNGLLYIDDEILSLQGEIDGRVTLVAKKDVRVTGDLRYVDGDGDRRMLGGGEPGGRYEPNPAYDGDSALGVVALGNILYAPAMPPNAEINGAFFSLTGTVGLEMLWYDAEAGLNRSGHGAPIYYWEYTAQGKETLKELGSKACSGMPSTGVEGTALGFAQTVSLYDPPLLTRPPPGFPSFPGVQVLSQRPVGRIVSMTVGERRGRTRKSSGALPKKADEKFLESVKSAVREVYRDFGVQVR